MDTGSYEFDKLSNTYKGFYNPCVSVAIEGSKLEDDWIVFEVQADLTIERSEVGTAVIKALNKKHINQIVKEMSSLKNFPLMGEIEIKLGYEQTEKTAFTGLITERTLEMIADQPVLTVYCMDQKALLRGNSAVQSYKEINSFGDLVTEVLKKYSFSKDIGSTEKFKKPMTISQYGSTDFDYINRIAEETGYEFFALDKKVYFRAPMSVSGNIIELGLDDIKYFSHTTSMRNACSSVEIIGYNQDTPELKSGKSGTLKKIGAGKTGEDFLKSKNLTLTNWISVQLSNRTDKDLNKTADMYMLEKSMKLTELTVVICGLPEIIPGRMIKIKDVNDEINNTYYIKNVSHKLSSDVYFTEIKCCSNTSAK